MLTLRFIVRNLGRHPLRNALTILGIAVSVLAFGLLRTTVDAWHAGVEASSATRLVTRNAISLIFTLPRAHGDRIHAVPGITAVSWGNWFGGIYMDEKNFFPNFAVDLQTYLAQYPEYLIDPVEQAALLRDRRGCIIGASLARRFGWKVGDTIPLKGTLFPGEWPLVVRAVYRGRFPNTDETLLFLHWEYINETLRKTAPRRADQVGFYVVSVADADEAGRVSSDIDAQFRNSLAETLTETERAFQLGFVAMSDAIITAIRGVSAIVVVVILALAANTMAMSARERMGEFATLKALGFGGGYLATLMLGESLTISLAGGGLGCLLSFPVVDACARLLAVYFPTFSISGDTLAYQCLASIGVGLLAGLVPAMRARAVRIAEALGRVG